MDIRARARQLASEYIAKDDPTGWFEQLYREAKETHVTIPWADLQPNPSLTEFWDRSRLPSSGRSALKVGCGLGDDAEQLSRWGFTTTAFDISQSAIATCKERFPDAKVTYLEADLLNPPREWTERFDFVLEAYTLQVLPASLRPRAIELVAKFVKPAGYLLVIARGRSTEDDTGSMPWPLLRCELDRFKSAGLLEICFEDYFDRESPPIRRFRALYKRVAAVR